MTETTLDKLLGGRMVVEQPAKGFRIAVDTLLLAASVPVQEGDRILDMGCGVGGVMLAIGTRVQDCDVTGIEIQKECADLCATNIERNGFEKRMRVLCGDVMNLDPSLHGTLTRVAINPPYNAAERHTAPPHGGKARANMDVEGEWPNWLASASLALADGGIMTMINRADRQEEILQLCAPLFGLIEIKPILPREGGVCKRLIFRAHKGGAAQVRVLPPFILYCPDGHYSEEAENLLRHAQAMVF